jgi:glyoxylase-like metal-dependent hydrolase (beta-lactamase superfamily II)
MDIAVVDIHTGYTRRPEAEMNEIQTLDLEFFGATEVIASFLAPTRSGFVMFDTGPASSIPVVERRLAELDYDLNDLQAVFATHVHLDHAGGAGVLARRTGCAVYAHPAGAQHLAEPGRKLLPSAERIYGEMMEPLWGKTVGVPEERVFPVVDGESVTVDGLVVRGWHTPGHASHHVAWQFDGSVATGDVAGVRFPGATHVLPPMPPPDIDVEAWRTSLSTLRSLDPQRLLLTHFGAFDDCARHLDELEDRLLRWTGTAREVVDTGGDRATLGAVLLAADEREMEASAVPPEAVARYRKLCPMEENASGLFRYCSQQLH